MTFLIKTVRTTLAVNLKSVKNLEKIHFGLVVLCIFQQKLLNVATYLLYGMPRHSSMLVLGNRLLLKQIIPQIKIHLNLPVS